MISNKLFWSIKGATSSKTKEHNQLLVDTLLIHKVEQNNNCFIDSTKVSLKAVLYLGHTNIMSLDEV